MLEQQHQDHQPLNLHVPSNDTPPAPPQNPRSCDVDTETQTDDTAHPMVVTIDTTTMIDSVQPPVVETSEKSTQADKAPCLQTIHASTQMVSQIVITTNETSTHTDRTPRSRPCTFPLKRHNRLTTTEKSTQTDRAPRPPTMQVATQTCPPSRNYQEELKAQIALVEIAQKRHNEAIAQLREQAVGREADLKRLLAESSAKLQAKEREVLDLQVANTEAKERWIKEEERNS